MRLLSSRSFFRDPVGYARAQTGDVLELASPTGRAALVRRPHDVWRVLVTDAERFGQGKWKRRARRFVGATLNTLDGDEHRARRALVQPSFDRRRIATFAPALAARAEAAQATWQDGDHFGLRRLLDPLSLTMAGDVLLGVDLGPRADELAAALADVMAALPRATPPVPGTRGAAALRRAHTIVAELAALRGESTDGDDLIAALDRSGFPHETSISELTAFLLAAADEPPSGLAAVWYLLGRSPVADERLAAELREGNAHGDEPRLPYLDAVLAEALRLFPPARYVDRRPLSELTVAGTAVGPGTNVLVSPLVTHRDASLFEDPDAFQPERWLDAEATRLPRGAYIPFGAGPHTCVGESLARLIMTTTLTTIASRWRLRVPADAAPPIPGRPDILVTVERR